MVTKPLRACVFSQYSRDTSSRRETCFVATVLIHPLTSKLPITAVVHFQTDFLIFFSAFTPPPSSPSPKAAQESPIHGLYYARPISKQCTYCKMKNEEIKLSCSPTYRCLKLNPLKLGSRSLRKYGPKAVADVFCFTSNRYIYFLFFSLLFYLYVMGKSIYKIK